VTGGAGFLGSHLCRLLSDACVQTAVLDDLSSPAGPGVAPAASIPGVELVTGSVCDAALVDRLVAGCEAVVHLAAVVGVRRVLEDPVRTLDVNIGGTTNVLEAAARHGRRVVYTSSSEVYGRGVRLPFTESDPLVMGPPHVSRWTYALSKLHGEMMGFELSRRDGMPFVAARMFNVVGPGQRADQGMVLPRFAQAALAGRPLQVHAPGTQRRCYLHAADAARILWRLLCEGPDGPLVVNVGSTQTASVLELAHRIRELARSDSPVDLVEAAEVMPPGFEEVSERVPSLDVLRSLLGAESLVPLEDTLREIVEAARTARQAAA